LNLHNKKMRKKLLIFTWVVICCVLHSSAQVKKIKFEPDHLTNFPNPERGIAPCIDPTWPKEITWKLKDCEGYTYTQWTKPLDEDSLVAWRMQGFSVVMIRYHISEFRNTAISQAFMERLNQDFSLSRLHGFKLIPRFVYNWPMGGPDASLEMVLKHIGQLKTILKTNVDVITYLDLGFIGAWGEQHHSCNGLVDAMWEPNKKSWQIVDSLFAALPPQRMVAMRYPFWKFRYFGVDKSDTPTAPLTETEAYTGSAKSRWAHHDDCLVCGEWNVGTWNNNRNNAQEVIDFLSEDNRFVFQGGEPGDVGNADEIEPDLDKDGYVFPHHTNCKRILDLFKKERWSILNASYGESFQNGAYADWRKNGCMDEIKLKLGYRFRLQSANIPTKAAVGKTFAMDFTIHNDGWSSAHNPRGLEIILRNKKTGKLHHLPITDGKSIPSDHKMDPRFWDGGKTITLKVSMQLSKVIQAGFYEVLLNLPDPLLIDKPKYSIRLANEDIWEKETGFNSLQHVLRVF
jgi:hypothetical protein